MGSQKVGLQRFLVEMVELPELAQAVLLEHWLGLRRVLCLQQEHN